MPEAAPGGPPPGLPLQRRMRPVLGTYVEVAGRAVDAQAVARGLEAALAAVDLAQRLWSFQDADSELSHLNRSPAGVWLPLHPATRRLLRLTQGLMRQSAGRFNPACAWALVQRGVLPDHGGPTPVDDPRPDDLALDAQGARWLRPQRWTLDGIAKGFAVDLAVRAMRQQGLSGGWVNAGGDLRVFGDEVLPIHRRELDGALTPLGALRDAALATSASGMADAAGRFPAQLMSGPADPAPPGVWTVLARRAWRADALTKVAAACPAAARGALIQSLGGQCLPLDA